MPTVASKDGTEIAYDIHGEGLLMLCVFGATCHRNFLPIKDDVKKFSKQFRVINYDRRGRGDSGDSSTWSLEKEIEDIEALIQANGGKAIIYGHSSGAVLALEAALRLPYLVDRVVVYDASYVADDNEAQEYAKLRSKIAAYLEAGKYKKALNTFLVEIGMPKLFVYALPLMPGYKKLVKLAPTLAYDMELTKSTPPLSCLKNLKTPALIMAGAKNGPSILSVHKQITEAIDGCESHVVAGQDHMVDINSIMPYVSRFVEGI